MHCLVAVDGLVSMVWCKHGFQRRGSIFNSKFVRFQRLWSKKNLPRNFQIKVRDCETEQAFEKAERNWHDGKMKWQR